jgi:DNA helicase-2/ATP-dependent DNA helicase PcrA
MTRAMNTLILTRAHYRRRYGNDAPELSIPSRFLEEIPSQLIENLSGRSPAWSTPAYGGGYRQNRYRGRESEYEGHYNYEDESQEAYNPAASRKSGANRTGGGSKPFVASWMKADASKPTPRGSAGNETAEPASDSIDNIAKFFGGKPGIHKVSALVRPSMEVAESRGAAGLKKGQRVRHSKYGEGTVLLREGDGDDAKLTVMFNRHGLKKLIEKFANLEKI